MPTRRTFLSALGLGAVALSGCDGVVAGAGDAAELLLSSPADPESGPARDLFHHLLNRCTTAVRPGDLAQLRALDPDPVAAMERWIDDQLAPPRLRDRHLDRRLEDLVTPWAAGGELFELHRQVLVEEHTWTAVLRLALGRDQVYEQVAAVWRDHLHIGPKGDAAWLAPAFEREVVRPHALGSAAAMLTASLRHAAMLQYLDGAVNEASHPNENLARELLELHTLGVGSGYTQHDVMEVARCLTGWTVRGQNRFRKGAVAFAPVLHDGGAKRVLGQDLPAGGGAEDVDRVVGLLIRQPACARRFASRLAIRFHGEDPPEEAIAAGAEAFARTSGDLSATTRAVLTCPAFRDPARRGLRLRRPLPWLAACLRVLHDGWGFHGPPRMVVAQAAERLGDRPGQHLTPDGPPNVHQAWTGTLWWRWHAAEALATEANGIVLDPTILWGRPPTAAEAAQLAAVSSAQRNALILAAPGFLRC